MVDGLDSIGGMLSDDVGWGLVYEWVVDILLGWVMGNLGDDVSEMWSSMSDSEDKLVGDEGSDILRVADQSGLWVTGIALSSCAEAVCKAAVFIY